MSIKFEGRATPLDCPMLGVEPAPEVDHARGRVEFPKKQGLGSFIPT